MDERGGKEDPGFKGTTSNRKEGRGEEGWEGREEKEMGKDERGGEGRKRGPPSIPPAPNLPLHHCCIHI